MSVSRKRFCIRGHDLHDPQNIIVRYRKIYSLRRGWYFKKERVCRGCQKVWNRRSYLRRQEQAVRQADRQAENLARSPG